MFDSTPSVESRLKELEADFERKRQAILEESIRPMKDELKDLEAQIGHMTAKADNLRAAIDKMLGGTGKVAGVRKVRAKRPAMTFEAKRAKVEEILKEERIATGYPVSAVAKRLQHDAHLTPADLSPTALAKFLPNGVSVEGNLRKKIFVLR